MNVVNLKSFFIWKFIKQQKIETISVLSPGHPLKNHSLNLNFFIYKVKFLFRNPLTIFILIETIIFSFLKFFFNLYPTYALQAGNKHFNSKNKNIKILKANSTDYSNYLIMKKKINHKNRKFALFLEQPTPLFDGDNFYQKFNKMNLQLKNGFQLLNLFLNI